MAVDHYNVYKDINPDFTPDYQNGTNRIAQTTETTYTDTDALAAETSYFYYVTAVAADGKESLLPSTLGCKLRHELIYTDGGANTHWLAIPQNPDYSQASDIGALSPNILQVIIWEAATQSRIVWQSDGSGTDFNLQPGQSCGIVINADTTLNLVGTLPAEQLNLVHNTDNFSANWFTLPQPNGYQTAAQLASAISNLTKIGRFNNEANTFDSWFFLDGQWMGNNFSLIPGQGLLAVVDDNTSWTPSTGFPQVTATVDVNEGLNTLDISLDGSASDSDGSIANYEWDFEGDGVFDMSDAASPATSFTYTAPGTYYPTLLVSDDQGFHGYSFQSVTIHGLQTDIAVEGFNPSSSENGDITLTITADGALTLRIYDDNDNLIATPVQSQAIAAGETTLQWNGTNDAGQTVADGVYHAVVDYEVNGSTFTHDQRSSGNLDISQDITDVEVSGTISLLEGEFAHISYTLPIKALVTVTVNDSAGSVIRHLLSDAPRIAGAHTEIWDGMGDAGVAVPADAQYFISIGAVSLAESAIMTAGATPEITGVSAAPLRFSPATNPYGVHDDRVTIDFSLNKTADITAQVYDASGAPVRTLSISAAATGTHQLSWNGRKDNGVLVADGLYSVRLSATDATGATSIPFTLQTEIYY